VTNTTRKSQKLRPKSRYKSRCFRSGALTHTFWDPSKSPEKSPEKLSGPRSRHFWVFWETHAWSVSRRGTSRKIGWGCAARFPKPLPYSWPKSAIFPTLFMTWPKIRNPIYDPTLKSKPVSDLRYDWFPSSDQCEVTINIICEGLLLFFISIMMKKWLLKNLPIWRLECKNHILFMTKIS